jgi:hypothetical protein
MKEVKNNSEGQAVVEYILMLVMVMSVVAVMAIGFRKSILSLWETFSREVSAACPRDCPPKDNLRLRR